MSTPDRWLKYGQQPPIAGGSRWAKYSAPAEPPAPRAPRPGDPFPAATPEKVAAMTETLRQSNTPRPAIGPLRAGTTVVQREPDPEALREDRARATGLGARFQSAANQFAQSFGAELPAGVLEGVALLAADLNLGHEYDGKEVSDLATYQAAQKIREKAAEWFPTNPDLQGRFVESVLPQAFGSMGSFLLGGVATGGGATFAGTTGALMQGGSAYTEAKAAGADERSARTAGELNLPLGATEAIPIERILGAAAPAAKKSAGRLLREGLISGGEEALQEGGQQLGGNVVARELYDPNRPLGQGVAQGAAAGFLVGGAAGAGAAGIGEVRGRRRTLNRPEPTVAPRATPPPTVAAVDAAAGAKIEAGEAVLVGAERREPGQAPDPEAPTPVAIQAEPAAAPEAASLPAEAAAPGAEATVPHPAPATEAAKQEAPALKPGVRYSPEGRRVLITPSTREPGRVQVTEFKRPDDDTPFGHNTFDSMDEANAYAQAQGYRIEQQPRTPESMPEQERAEYEALTDELSVLEDVRVNGDDWLPEWEQRRQEVISRLTQIASPAGPQTGPLRAENPTDLFGEERAPTVEQSGLFTARDLAPGEKAAAERVTSRAMNADEIAAQTSAARAEGAAPVERDQETAELFDAPLSTEKREQRTATFHKTRGAAKALKEDALLTRYRAALRNHLVAGARADAYEGKGGRIKRDYADPDQPIGMVGTGAGAFQRGSQTQADARLMAYEEEIRSRGLPIPHPDDAFIDAKVDDLPRELQDEYRSLGNLEDDTLLERWGLAEENAAGAPDDVTTQVRRAIYAAEVRQRGLSVEEEPAFSGAGLAYAPKRTPDTARLIRLRQAAEADATSDRSAERMLRIIQRGAPRRGGSMGTPKVRADLTAARVQKFSQELKDRHGLARLEVTLRPRSGDIDLSMIEMPAEDRGAGGGSAAMEELVRFADQQGRRIVLTPDVKNSERGTTSRSRLVNFYRRFGFVENKGRHRDFEIRDGMYREPRPIEGTKGTPRGRGRMGSPARAAADPLLHRTERPISPDLLGQLETPTKPQPGKPVSAPQVVAAFGKIAKAAGKDVPVRVGRLGTKSARGVFKVRDEVIRILEANDLPTAAHEVAHAVEKLLFGWPKGGPWVSGRVDHAIQRELTQMGRDLYGDRVPNGGYKREGWAEYVRMWLTTEDEAQTKAPNLTRWFDGAFAQQFPEVRKSMETAREMAGRWRTQGSLERAAQSMVDPAAPLQRVKRAAEKVQHFFSMEQQIEMAAPLDRLARAAEASSERAVMGGATAGKKLAPEDDPYLTLSALRMTHSARARYMVEHGMIDLQGNVTGPALNDIRALVQDRRQDFTLYLWARRAERLWLDPEGPRNPGLSLEDAQQVIQELDSPEFQLAASKVYEWNDGVLDYAAEASPTFAHVVERIRERDPGDWVPLLREFEELDAEWGRSGGANARSGSISKRLKGSGRRTKDVFQAMIAKAESTVRAAHERVVIDQILRLSKLEGLGHIIEEVPVNQQPAAAATIREIISRVNQELAPEAGVELKAEKGTDLSDLMGQTLTFFAPAQRPDGKAPIVPLWEDGNVKWFEVDPKLYHALASLDVYRMPDVADLLVGAPNRLFRAGTTGLRASFGLIWNPLRDWQTLYVNTQSHANGAKLFGTWLQSMAEAAVYRTTGKASPWIDAFVRMGGEMSLPLGQDIPHTRRATHKLFQGRTVRTLDPRNWFDFYRDLVQFPETAARVSELRLVARQIGWKPGQPMTLSQSMQLLLAAKQVTTDFTAAGEFGRLMNQIVPFYNASLQGPRASVRAARRSTQTFVLHGLQLTVASLLLWWRHKDDEWYQEMPYRERALNWHIPFTNPSTGREELVRIPRAFDTGAMFAAMPEMFLDAWYRDDPAQATAWFTTFLASSNPVGLPVVLSEAGEQAANRDFFWQTPIVPRSEEHRPVEEQFNEYTSRAAITLGQTFGVSPRRIDHAINGVFGPVGGDVLGVLGLGPKGVEREQELADTPIVGRIFQRGGAVGTHPRSVEALYVALEAAQKRQHSEANPETPDERRQRLQLEDATKALSALSYVRSKTHGAAQREKITASMLSITGDALALHRDGKLARGRVKGLRKSAERLEAQIRKQPAAAQDTKR